MGEGSAAGATLSVRLIPRGRADRGEGVETGGVLLVRVDAAPVGGAANRALLRLIARDLSVPASCVTLLSGQRGRHKRLRVQGPAPDPIREHWPGVAVS